MEQTLRAVKFSSGARHRCFNFSSYYLNETLSDVTILIRIAVNGNSNIPGRAVVQRLPGHGVVLSNVSRVFREDIEQQQGLGGKPTIHLDVQPDQVAAACAAVRFIYTGDLPEPTSTQQPLLVHMLQLADKFGVSDCRTACLDVLMHCTNLQPAALGLAFLVLPAPGPTPSALGGAAEDSAEGFGPLLRHCLDQLQQQLGDMESVLRCPDQLSLVHGLPIRALLALLHDERTSAASENTVLAVVHSWMGAAAQRDVRVDADQRQQLAAAVRVPLLEPCYLATVLPRMNWLLEILGPQGLATAAGVARGLCDPHAEPILCSGRACGPLAAGWLQGPRPVPASCSRAVLGGPALIIDWSVPLADVKAAFEAACAEAAAKALALQQQREAAAAAARQAALVSAEPPAWGLGLRSPMATATAAAAMSAVANAAAAAAARVFSKRKRDSSAVESVDEGGRDQQSSSTTAVTRPHAGRAGQQQVAPALQQQQQVDEDAALANDDRQQVFPPQGAFTQPSAVAGSQEEREDYTQHTRKRRRRAAASQEAAAPVADGPAGTPKDCMGQAARQAAAAHTPKQAAVPLQPLSPQAGAAVGARATRGTSTAAAGAAPSPRCNGSLSSGGQHTPRQFKVRSQETQFAGYTWRLVLYFQQREASAAAVAAGPAEDADAGAAYCCEDGELGAVPPAAGGMLASDRGAARSAVAAAHAVSLPEAEAGAAGAAPAISCCWTARLAFEARPCVVLQPGVSTAAFSGSLAARLNEDHAREPSGRPQSAAAAAGARRTNRSGAVAQHRPGTQRQGRGRVAAAAAATADDDDRGAGQGAGSQQDVGVTPARRHDRTGGTSPARYYTSVTGAAGAAGGGLQHRAPHEQQPSLLSIPESDEEQSDSEGRQAASSEQRGAVSIGAQDSDDDDDDGCMVVGEYNAAVGYTGSAAASPRSSRRRKQQRPRSRAAGRRPESAGVDGREQQQQQEPVTPGMPAAQEAADDEGSWRTFQLPQGSWLKSRHCDTGFRNFFTITLQHDNWDEVPWQPYLQEGDVLQLRGCVWNVR